jgi:hypothetical protein
LYSQGLSTASRKNIQNCFNNSTIAGLTASVFIH